MKTTLLAVTVVVLGLTGCFRPGGEGGDGGGTASAGGGAAAGGGSATGGGGTEPQVPMHLEIAPAAVTVPVGQSVAVRALMVALDGQSEDVTARVTWLADRQGVLGVENGLIRGLSRGEGSVSAQLGERTATATVKVIDQTVTELILSPARLSLPVGASAQVSVLARLSGGGVIDVSSLAALSTSPPGVLAVAPGGAVRAIGAGTATLLASYGGATGTITVQVTERKLQSLTISPGTLSLAVGATATLTARGLFDDQTTADLTQSAMWSSGGPAARVTIPGVVQGVSSGSAVISATFQGIVGTLTVDVRDAALTKLTLSPSTASIAKGTTQAFTATGFYADGRSANLTSNAVFSVDNAGLATVSNASGTRGVATGLAAGKTTVTARVGMLEASAGLEVTALAFKSLEWVPSVFNLKVGASASATVVGTRTDGSKEDVTGDVLVSVDDPSIAKGQLGMAPAPIQVQALAVGSTLLRARLGGAEAVSSVTVTPASSPVVALTVAPDQLSLTPGKTLPVKAMARFGDGHVEDVSEQATWASSDGAVASVSSNAGTRGLVTANASGTASITATFQALNAKATATVAARAVVGFSLSPSLLRMPKQNYEYIEATLAYSDGTTDNVSTTVTWTSSNPSAASVEIYQSGQGDYAYIVSDQPGTATITATTAGGQTATCQVTVTSATLTSLEISPAQPRLAPGASVDLSAVGVFSDLTTMNLKYWSSWTSSNPAVAQVDNGQGYGRGKVKALSAGTTTITANFDGVVATTVVTVSSATLTQIQVTPFAPKLPVGFDTYFHATAVFSDNTTQDISYDASWTSSATATLSVNSYGQVRPTAAGTATVSATYQGVTGSEVVTVSAATLSAIAVSPANPTLGVQALKQLYATGTFSDGFSMDITAYVTWLSSDPGVAKVSNAAYSQGQAKGLAPGTTTITAARGLVGGNTTLTVSP